MKRQADVICVTISAGGRTGRGESVPYARYGESVTSVATLIQQVGSRLPALCWPEIAGWIAREVPAGAARFALEAAVIDVVSKATGVRAWDLLGIATPRPRATARTVSLGTPEEMAEAACAMAGVATIKVKLGSDGDLERLSAVREAQPNAMLVIDANEGWSATQALAMLEACCRLGVSWVEQPVAAGADECLRERPSGIIVCADESIHTAQDLDALRDRYDAVNIKLDKAGGVVAALELADAAKRCEMPYMLGCMVCTSLAIAPAMLLANDAAWLDLDGPLWLAEDRQQAGDLRHWLEQGAGPCFSAELWG